jgi:hypothetical protein
VPLHGAHGQLDLFFLLLLLLRVLAHRGELELLLLLLREAGIRVDVADRVVHRRRLELRQQHRSKLRPRQRDRVRLRDARRRRHLERDDGRPAMHDDLGIGDAGRPPAGDEADRQVHAVLLLRAGQVQRGLEVVLQLQVADRRQGAVDLLDDVVRVAHVDRDRAHVLDT